MNKLTEYHSGKAVIKDKTLLPRAMERLAEYEKLETYGCVLRWRPTSKPPKSKEYVLLSFENYALQEIGRYEEDKEGGAYYIGDDNSPCVSYGLIVNAWAKLPKPYREKQEEVMEE